MAMRKKKADNSLNLFLNVRVLLQLLEREDPKLKMQAVQAVQYCSKRHKTGDPDFAVLSKSIDKMLRMIVGEKRWKLAEDCQRRLQAKQALAKVAAKSSAGGGGTSAGTATGGTSSSAMVVPGRGRPAGSITGRGRLGGNGRGQGPPTGRGGRGRGRGPPPPPPPPSSTGGGGGSVAAV